MNPSKTFKISHHFLSLISGLVITTGLLNHTLYAAEITGAGSTFVYPALSAWAQKYHTETGAEINYQAVGSGAGIAQIKAKTVDFAATDKPLSTQEVKTAHVLQFPVIMGGIVMGENISGLSQSDLVLNGKIISDIYLKKITFWDDKNIQALNPKLHLPHQAITPVYRADASGTTYNFTNYLSQVNPDFAKSLGASTTVKFPVGIAGKGNAGVASYIKTISGSIGYVEFAYAEQNHLSFASMAVNQNNIIDPAHILSSFKNAAKNAVADQGIYHFPVSLANAWPMMAATYVLLPLDNTNLAQSKTFFTFVFKHPEIATNLHYVAIPKSVTEKITAAWA